jgi:hypothetical protein
VKPLREVDLQTLDVVVRNVSSIARRIVRSTGKLIAVRMPVLRIVEVRVFVRSPIGIDIEIPELVMMADAVGRDVVKAEHIATATTNFVVGELVILPAADVYGTKVIGEGAILDLNVLAASED